jgi:probable HAF family extracellular repeat protein
MEKFFRLSSLVLLGGTVVTATTLLSFNFFSFSYPNSTSTLAAAINNKGQVVGSYSTSSSYGQGFIRNPDGAFIPIQLPYSSIDSPATGINSAGDVVGSFYDPDKDVAQGYLRTAAGVYSIIADPANPNDSGAFGINDVGQIVGTYTDARNVGHGFIRDAQGLYKTIDNPNESVDPDGIEYSQLNAINNHGQMVGVFTDAAGQHGFAYKLGGTFITIDVPNSQAGTTTASGINDLGEIVGYYSDAFNVTHGFIRSADGGTYTTVDDPLSKSGTLIRGINDQRQIVGSFAFEHAFIAR